ncbi:MAG: MlaD family protein [Sulfurimonas sp.]|uniref:MlaD family protein n=1 Tax=Sulfurimonas sp. TaxID=2022749 RepID=UPI002612111D|nr:MlaD family protein [Sulfurimonas sp.]MDD5400305.1 MlaD family protein [Sulfurimonas sp.]
MNNRVNYSLVGFLVLFALSAMMGFGYWLLKPSKEIEMKVYAIYFDESVLGLNMDAPVKYRGINVGKVTALNINPKNSEQVEVLINVLKNTPIKSSTVAQLTSQGITGLSYINLSFGDGNAPFLERKKGEEYPVIKTIPSLLIKLENTFGDVTYNLSETLQRTKELLKEENQAEFSLLLKNSAVFVSKMNQILDDETIVNVKETMKNLNSASKKIDEMMPRVEKLIDNSIGWENNISASFGLIVKSYAGIAGSMNTFKEALQSGDFNLREMSSDLLPTMNNTLFEMQNLIIKIEDTLDKHDRSPSDIIFMKEQIKKGPGEK